MNGQNSSEKPTLNVLQSLYLDQLTWDIQSDDDWIGDKLAIFNIQEYRLMDDTNSCSLSLHRYCSLGARVKYSVHLDEILQTDTEIHIPPVDSNSVVDGKVDWNRDMKWSEKMVKQKFLQTVPEYSALFHKYFINTSKAHTFLGSDLMPDIMVSAANTETILGEYQVLFFIDLKAQNVNPDTDTNVGQAVAYLIRLLELSSAQFRRHAVCCVTNLIKGVIVQVLRGVNGWEFKKSTTSAEMALLHCFAARPVDLGLHGRNDTKVMQKYYPRNYLGSGASAVVYSCGEDCVMKFYYGQRQDAMESLNREKVILKLLRYNLPPDILLQTFIAEEIPYIETRYPCLVMSPLGSRVSAFKSDIRNHKRVFKCLWAALKYAHSRSVLHNDIRPENIIQVTDGQCLLIDWTAAWDVGKMTPEVDNNKLFREGYTGNVTCATDSILRELQTPIIDDKGRYVVTASVLTDTISFVRTMFIFTHRVSLESFKELRQKRSNEDFQGVIDWWSNYLSDDLKSVEAECITAFFDKGDCQGIVDEYLEHFVSNEY